MSEGNGAAKTLPLAMAADFARLEELSKRQEAQRSELRTVKDLVIKLAHSIDLTREDQRATLAQVSALTDAVSKLNEGVQLVIGYLVPGNAKPTPPDSPLAKTQPSTRKAGK